MLAGLSVTLHSLETLTGFRLSEVANTFGFTFFSGINIRFIYFLSLWILQVLDSMEIVE